jgi:NADH-quinone oxidoreductase subunit M
MFGPLDKPENKVLRDLSVREIMVLLPLAVMFFVMGIYPKPFLSRMEPTVSELIKSKFEERVTVRDNPAELLNKNLAYPGKTRLLDK